MHRPSWIGILFIAAYAGTILAANWAINQFGIVDVGFGLQAPAAVFFAGLAFTFRDLVHESAGRAWAFVAILVGAAMSFALAGGTLAVASGAAFLFSEGLDFVVYDRLRRRGWLTAVAASNVFGFIADSVIFLTLAFGSLSFLAGQILGKAYMTLLALAVLWVWRRLGGWYPGEGRAIGEPA